MIGQKRLARGGTLAVVVVALLLLSFWFLGPPSGTNAQLQNRPQATFPPLSLSAVGDVATFEQTTAALSDRLRAKPDVIAAVNSAVLGITGRSASSSVVAAGDRLYFAGEFTEPCLSPAYETWAAAAAQHLTEVAQAGGRQVIFVVVPSKSVVEPAAGVTSQALTACQRWARGVLQRIADEPGSPVRMIDPQAVRDRGEGAAFWRADTHWTPAGGLALADLLAEEVGSDAEGRFVAGGEFDKPTDLDRLLGAPGAERTQDWVPRAAPSMRTFPNGTSWPGTAFTSPDPLPDAPTLLLVYDSFVYATGLEDTVASLFPAGWLLQWDAMPTMTGVGDAELVVLESTDRLALQRLASMNPGGANQPFLDYLAGG